MATVSYSHKAIAALPAPTPPRRQEEHGVQGQTGLIVIASNTGTKDWYLRYQRDCRRRRKKLGSFPGMGLKAAADAAVLFRAKLAEGIDPADQSPDEEATFGELCAVYLEHKSTGKDGLAKRTMEERRRILYLPELNRLRSMQPAKIKKVDIARVLDPFQKRGALVMMNAVQRALSAVFAWAIVQVRYGVESNPVAGMKLRYKAPPRDRVLEAEEMAVMWRDLEARTPLFRVALRLILLTGQRPGEVCEMRWEHIDGSTWTMPPGYRKATGADRGRPSKRHRVHLSTPAVSELESIRGWERGGFVFPARHVQPPAAVSRQSLARTVAGMVHRLKQDRWTPHDLRRTARTGFGEHIHADAVVSEKIVGHALPALLRVYDQGEQWDARVDVLDRWGEWLLRTVT